MTPRFMNANSTIFQNNQSQTNFTFHKDGIIPTLERKITEKETFAEE